MLIPKWVLHWKKFTSRKKKAKGGRPKGSKNKKPKGSKNLKIPKKHQRRGPKTPRNSGRAFRINNDDTWLGLKWFDKNFQGSQIPSLGVIQELVFLGFAIFKGGAIVSNLIESMNAVVRNSLPDRGLKTQTHLLHHINGVMKLNSATNGTSIQQSAVPIAKKTGLINLGQFLKPDIDQIQVLVELKGLYQ